MIKNNKLYCDFCQKEINREKRNRDKESKHHFCCKKCESEFRKGKLTHPNKKNEILLLDNYAIIKIQNRLLGNFDCIIDKEDIEILSQYYWILKHDKRHPNLIGYIETHPNGKRLFIHRLLMNPPSGMVVDHINGNSLDNRKKNLRICAQTTNCQNRKNVTNIYFDKRTNIYFVQYMIDGKTKVICRTKDYNEAKKYSIIGKELIRQGKLDDLLNMPCKYIDLPKNNKSGFLGIAKIGKKYQSWLKGKYLGVYDTAEEAVAVRKQAEIDYQSQNKV